MKSGIYKIENLINGKIYIGSCKDFYKRYHNHFSKLKLNKHFSKHLQSSFNKYGQENFKFQILVKCPVEYLMKMEQWFIDNMKPAYNKRIIAERNTGIMTEEQKDRLRKLRIGTKLSEEHKSRLTGRKSLLSITEKENLRERMTNRIVSDETRTKMSESKKGKPSPRKGTVTSPETKLKQSESRKKYFETKKLENAI